MQHQHSEIDTIEAQWLRLFPQMRLEEMLTLIALHRTSQTMLRAHDQFLEQFGLNFSAADVLFSLYRSAPPEGLTLAGLAGAMTITPPAMTARIDRLLDSGWIEKTADPADRRVFRVCLTGGGKRLVEKMLPLHVEHKKQLFSGLSDPEIQTLRSLLSRLLAAVPEPEK